MSPLRAFTLAAAIASACGTPDPATALRGDLDALRSEIGDLRGEVAELGDDMPELVRGPEHDRLRKIHHGRPTMPAQPGEPLQIILDPQTSATLTDASGPDLQHLARAIPHHDNAGQMDGFRLSGIKKGSLMHAIGLRSGDVVHEVDGQPLRGPADAARLSEALATQRRVTLDLSRRGSRHTLTIEHP